MDTTVKAWICSLTAKYGGKDHWDLKKQQPDSQEEDAGKQEGKVQGMYFKSQKSTQEFKNWDSLLIHMMVGIKIDTSLEGKIYYKSLMNIKMKYFHLIIQPDFLNWYE